MHPNDDARYDRIGLGHASRRREDPELRARIHAALSDARTVVNVGAGAGSYEPRDRHMIAIEPSDVMAAQRPPELAPAIRASAEALPPRDGTVDAAMAVITIHRWDRVWLRCDRTPALVGQVSSRPGTASWRGRANSPPGRRRRSAAGE